MKELIKKRIIELSKKHNISSNIVINAIKKNTIYTDINGLSCCVLCGHTEQYHNYYSCKLCECGGKRSLTMVTMPINYCD
jgi:hypothetical protein